MPVATTRLAQVGPRDSQPLVLGRSDEHPLEQLPIGALNLGAIVERSPRLGDPGGQGVAHRLELTEIESFRLHCDRRHRRGESEARKGLAHQARELTLQATDLTPQLSAGEELVATDEKLSPAVSIQQIRHNPFECRSDRLPVRRWLR